MLLVVVTVELDSSVALEGVDDCGVAAGGVPAVASASVSIT